MYCIQGMTFPSRTKTRLKGRNAGGLRFRRRRHCMTLQPITPSLAQLCGEVLASANGVKTFSNYLDQQSLNVIIQGIEALGKVVTEVRDSLSTVTALWACRAGC